MKASIDVKSVICAKSSSVDCVFIVSLTLVVTGILLGRWIDLHLGLDAIFAHFVFVNLNRKTF